jgi:23S rRNA (cytidine1920-2'-O)/16S rRNA (cytidine1409-2'-O)-methyltransferase
MGKRERLDKLLVERGLARSREEGQKRILAGEVFVNDQPISKVGNLVDSDAVLRLKDRPLPYVSRGGIKLEKALKDFRIEVKDKIVLDVGASAGGFTDCLLVHGARKVYAVDVGYGQLDWKVRKDARVVVLEKRNIRYLKAEELPQPPELATIDVSFISLRLVLPQVQKLLVSKAEILALIKPQFEVGKGKVGKGGVVRSHEEHLRVIEEVRAVATSIKLEVKGVAESQLLGPKGNKEFFIFLAKGNVGS